MMHAKIPTYVNMMASAKSRLTDIIFHLLLTIYWNVDVNGTFAIKFGI